MAEIVSVSGGKVRGTSDRGVTRFLGIPYAAAPVGPARFEAPRPVAEWSGVRDALEFGPTCVQSPYPPPIHALLGSDGIPGDDYLNVNVWTPEQGGSGLPVLVWIHGGAFVRGSNARAIYDGSSFARDGVVMVSINYRLGVSGFAAVPGSASNRGLRDQIFALEWVQENITAFGGDPGNVTVFGESAGGMSVVALLASPRARGLFRRAIAQSANGSGVATAEDAGKVAGQLAQVLGIEPTVAAFGALGPEALRTAQDAVALALMTDPDPARWGASIITNGLGIMSFFPVIDGDIVPERPTDVLVTQPDLTVPLLTGWTAEEFRFFTFPVGLAAAITEHTLPQFLGRYGVGPAVADCYAAHRPGATPADVFAAVVTDLVFRDDVMRIAEATATAGNPAFVYEFAWRTPVPDLGACHVMEIPFVFDRLDAAPALTGPTPPQPLADEVHRAWVRFATQGDPGWSRFDPATRTVHVFDAPHSHDVADPRADELRALRRARLGTPVS
ncbi:carboxylesterase/lipase family protein [Nocardia yunnanensis]|uniref:Carboxylic ester hydrolase n=1 Tax=Nocardia yunnanensis TaxID=2382165 RepID=A0A386ZGY6_9NOCA|nr:carboxylesterase family protein [Nocardia yunnanensis]AYF76746.1 carboxylesterase/lipase family protein [Nocardia yunnanensis]